VFASRKYPQARSSGNSQADSLTASSMVFTGRNNSKSFGGIVMNPNFSLNMLPGSLLEKEIKRLAAAVEAVPIMRSRQRFEFKHGLSF